MEPLKIQIIESVTVLGAYIITHYVTKTFVNHSLKQTLLQRGRRKMILKAVNLLSLLTAIIFIAAIWGLNQNEIAVYVGTILTALGIAFFAHWSLLSNVTSSVLLFFNHPIKIGDFIKIFDKDSPVEGEVTDLTYFFVHVKTDTGELITIPNALLFQKSIVIIEKK